MAEKIRDLKSTLSRSLPEAIDMTVDDAIDAGIDLENIERNPKVKARRTNITEGLNELVNIKSRGTSIPGQSLTNNPEEPNAWETPPTYSNPREALDNINNFLMSPEGFKSVLNALSKGTSVGDIAMSILYAKYYQGDITPDVMLLIFEPILYVIMAIGEEGGIDYNIDGDDVDEPDEDEVQETLQKFRNVFEEIKSGAIRNMSDIPKEVTQQVQEQAPDVEVEEPSLLERREE
jgi:hypothetical protein|tara:strand:+ start:229 stop:930 length:702 start_codon:yes stop_codon:yes gene_type:complete